MKIQYVNTMQDLVAFNRYHARHSPTIRLTLLIATWALPILLLLTGLCFAVLDDDLLLLLSTAAVALFWVALFKVLLTSVFDWQVRRMYREGRNKGTLGPHELELTDRRLIERNPYGEQVVLLDVVERVASTHRHTFIYVSAVGAHVIPHDAVEEGDYPAFVEAVERQLAKMRHQGA
jgi:hypothetical protein